MKIIFFGTPQFAVPSLEKLIQDPDITVQAVVTQPDKRRGRGKQLIPSPVKSLATQHQIPVWQPQRVKKDLETLQYLQQSDADVFIVVAYGQILSQNILDVPRLGCINGHGSLLPKYRGAAPIQWCLYNGESETGITTMLMNAGMDTGSILLKEKTSINISDNAHNLAKTLSLNTANLLIKTIDDLNQQRITPEPQNDSQATYAPLISKDDYLINWSRSALALHNQIRGFYPNCITIMREQTLKIKSSIPIDIALCSSLNSIYQSMNINVEKLLESLNQKQFPPGVVAEVLKNHGPIISTGTGFLLLLEAQLAGRRSQSGWDFANGTRLEVEEQLG
ncbi:MAG: methionyl-tRNA formyltransferase [Cyanobacteria bacterium P01_E01_bin.6]